MACTVDIGMTSLTVLRPASKRPMCPRCPGQPKIHSIWSWHHHPNLAQLPSDICRGPLMSAIWQEPRTVPGWILCAIWLRIKACKLVPTAATSCGNALPIASSCSNCWVFGLCRPEDGPEHTKRVLKCMMKAEPALASSAGAELAGTGLKAPAARKSPERPPAQATGAAAGSHAADETDSRAEAAQAGPHAAAVSASSVPDASRRERQRDARAQAAARQPSSPLSAASVGLLAGGFPALRTPVAQLLQSCQPHNRTPAVLRRQVRLPRKLTCRPPDTSRLSLQRLCPIQLQARAGED